MSRARVKLRNSKELGEGEIRIIPWVTRDVRRGGFFVAQIFRVGQLSDRFDLAALFLFHFLFLRNVLLFSIFKTVNSIFSPFFFFNASEVEVQNRYVYRIVHEYLKCTFHFMHLPYLYLYHIIFVSYKCNEMYCQNDRNIFLND